MVSNSGNWIQLNLLFGNSYNTWLSYQARVILLLGSEFDQTGRSGYYLQLVVPTAILIILVQNEVIKAFYECLRGQTVKL